MGRSKKKISQLFTTGQSPAGSAMCQHHVNSNCQFYVILCEYAFPLFFCQQVVLTLRKNCVPGSCIGSRNKYKDEHTHTNTCYHQL